MTRAPHSRIHIERTQTQSVWIWALPLGNHQACLPDVGRANIRPREIPVLPTHDRCTANSRTKSRDGSMPLGFFFYSDSNLYQDKHTPRCQNLKYE